MEKPTFETRPTDELKPPLTGAFISTSDLELSWRMRIDGCRNSFTPIVQSIVINSLLTLCFKRDPFRARDEQLSCREGWPE